MAATPQFNIDPVIDEQSYNEMLLENEPLVQAIALDVQHGCKPEDIKRHFIATFGENRIAMALRCEQVARHVARTAGANGDDGIPAPLRAR